MFSNNLIYILLFSLFNLALNNAFNVDEYTNAIKDLMQNYTFIQDFDNHLAECLSIDPNYFEYKNEFTFDCDFTPSEQAPRSVHKLRPSDIKVVGALGDSLTASVGTRAKTIFGLLIEYREVSWSMGGEADLNKFLTLPNILKVFNPKLIGYSVKPSFVLTSKKGVGFNAAVSGQKAYHVIDQARPHNSIS